MMSSLGGQRRREDKACRAWKIGNIEEAGESRGPDRAKYLLTERWEAGGTRPATGAQEVMLIRLY